MRRAMLPARGVVVGVVVGHAAMCASACPRRPASSASTTSPVAAFTSGGPPRKIVPCSLTMIALVRHRRHVGAAGGAAAHHHRDLRDALAREGRLVVEDPTEVLAVREHLGPAAAGWRRPNRPGRCRAGGSRLRDLLRAQVLLHGQRVVGAALDRRVVGHDDALPPADPTDARDHARGRHGVVVHAEGRELRQLDEGRARIEQALDPIPRQHLAAIQMSLPRSFRPALPHATHLLAQVVDEGTERRGVLGELGRAGGHRATQNRHQALLEGGRELIAALADLHAPSGTIDSG